MTSIVPYSEKQKILPVEDWESARLLDQDCTTSKVAAEYMRRVVSRLLTGKNVDINDFEFVVMDEKEPNAGFISSHKTLNHKNVIMITKGVLKLCKNEDEFAAILGHELGHFTYDKIYGDNKNTLGQERAADLNSLNLLIAGGYNPEGYVNVCEEMRKSSPGPTFFEVHGSSMCRKEDVENYLSAQHISKGDFKTLSPTGDWRKFKRTMRYGKDKYKPYFAQLLEANFPKIKNLTYQVPIEDVFDLILSEVKGGRIHRGLRVREMFYYLKNTDDQRAIRASQKFIEQFAGLSKDKRAIGVPGVSGCGMIDLFNVVKRKFHANKPFKIFPPADKLLADIKEFKESRDQQRIMELVKSIRNAPTFGISDIKELFGQDIRYKMPPLKKAKGTIIPTDELMFAYYKTGKRPIYDVDVVGVLRKIGFDCEYEWRTDKTLDAVSVDGRENYMGKIIAVGKDIEKAKEAQQRQNEYKKYHDDFKKFISELNSLYDFKQGKISIKDVSVNIKDLRRARRYWEPIYLTDYKHENTFLKSDIQELNNSEAFAEIYIKPFIKVFKQALHNVSPQLKVKIHLDKPPKGKTWLEYLQELSSKYLNLKEKYSIQTGRWNYSSKLVKDLYNAGRNAGVVNSSDQVWNVPLGPVVWYISGLYTTELYEMMMHFFNVAEQQKLCSRHDVVEKFGYMFDTMPWNWSGNLVENKLVKNIENLIWDNNIILRKRAFDYHCAFADKVNWAKDTASYIDNALLEELFEGTELSHVKYFLSAFGMLANTEQELIDVMSKSMEKSFDMLSNGFCEKKLKEFALMYYMRKNLPIKDLHSVLVKSKLYKDRISNYVDYADYHDRFKGEFADYIEKNNLMPNDFEHLYNVYAVMEKLDIFSEEKSNQSKWLNSLIVKIDKMSRQSREYYSWRLLSGFYYFDADDFHELNRDSGNMKHVLARNKLLEIYSNAVAERLGRDDNTDEYLSKIHEWSNFINQKHSIDRRKTRAGIDKSTKADLYRLVSDKIQSQERVSQFLADDKTVALSDEDAQKSNLWLQGAETLLDRMKKNISINTIEFLNTKLTPESLAKYREKCASCIGYDEVEKYMHPSFLENFYHFFWSSDLKVRAVIMGKLLNRAFETLDEKIKYVCDMNFAKDSKYRADAEMICDCVIKSFEAYEQTSILAAIASADENKQEGKNASRSVGDGLRMFFENMGPAWVKFGQLLSYVPNLPSEIRRDLGKLKDKADMPARWDFYTWMREALPNELYNRIERVENIVGAGSFWMTAVVQLKNDMGQPEKKVVQILRPNADARSDSGFKTIESAIAKLSKRDASYKKLQNVARQAHDSAKYEVDHEVGNKQYEKAKELYGDIVVEIEGTTYTPKVADWRYHGVGKDGMAYKIMDFAKGETLSRIKVDDNEKRKMALAYFTIEMVNLFKGDVWDIDRHQGQQNFEIISPTSVNINIYDTGAQLPNPPDKKNKVLLANIFFGLAKTVQAGKSIDDYLLKTIKRLDNLQKLNVDVSFVSNVQKGLMALSDIIEYKKEIKDADGNIIQQRKMLSGDDLRNAIMAVLKNPTVDKYLNVVIQARAVFDKLKSSGIRATKDFIENAGLDDNNPVKITIVDNDKKSLSHVFNKARDEIDAMYNPDDYILGVNKKYIKNKKNENEQTTGPLKQVGLVFG